MKMVRSGSFDHQEEQEAKVIWQKAALNDPT